MNLSFRVSCLACSSRSLRSRSQNGPSTRGASAGAKREDGSCQPPTGLRLTNGSLCVCACPVNVRREPISAVSAKGRPPRVCSFVFLSSPVALDPMPSASGADGQKGDAAAQQS